jgi:hypothetical protein
MGLVSTLAGLAALGAGGCYHGPSAPSEVQVVETTARGNLPAGTTMWVQLDEPITPGVTQPGDRFVGHVSQELRAPNGDILVPRGATVEGHVAEIRHGTENQPATARLAFDSLDMNQTREPLRGATLVQMQVAQKQPEVKPGYVGVGAAGGAVLGAIISQSVGGALVGGLAGAAAGTLISLGTTGGGQGEAIPKGSQMAIKLGSSVRSYASMRKQPTAY